METYKYDDMPLDVYHLMKLPFKIAMASFAIGTFLLLLFFFIPEKDQIIGLGICYVILAFIVNVIALLVFVVLSFRHKDYQWDIISRACLLLINIPVALFYFSCVVDYMF